nr:hypothetical protein [uncultured Carboxylicivirga sp.]
MRNLNSLVIGSIIFLFSTSCSQNAIKENSSWLNIYKLRNSSPFIVTFYENNIVQFLYKSDSIKFYDYKIANDTLLFIHQEDQYVCYNIAKKENDIVLFSEQLRDSLLLRNIDSLKSFNGIKDFSICYDKIYKREILNDNSNNNVVERINEFVFFYNGQFIVKTSWSYGEISYSLKEWNCFKYKYKDKEYQFLDLNSTISNVIYINDSSVWVEGYTKYNKPGKAVLTMKDKDTITHSSLFGNWELESIDRDDYLEIYPIYLSFNEERFCFQYPSERDYATFNKIGGYDIIFSKKLLILNDDGIKMDYYDLVELIEVTDVKMKIRFFDNTGQSGAVCIFKRKFM